MVFAITPPFSQGRFTTFCFCSSAAPNSLFYSPFSRLFFHHHMLQASRKQSTKNNRAPVNHCDAVNCSFILHSISSPGSFLCSLSNYVIWTVGWFGIRRRRWLARRENMGIIGWQMQPSPLSSSAGSPYSPNPRSSHYCHKLHVYFTSCTPSPLVQKVNYRKLAASLSVLTTDDSQS